MQQDLFSSPVEPVASNIADSPDYLCPCVQISAVGWLLKGALLPVEQQLMQDIHQIARKRPFRQRRTPGGQKMSVAMTNCGAQGWVTDPQGYRYAATEPETGLPWPAMPPHWLMWVTQLAARVGFDAFQPDACLLNRYRTGAGMGLHQDRDETDLSAPIVSFSLGAPVLFRWGGLTRQDPAKDILLEHGDVLIWGGEDRLRFHGVKKLKPFDHPLTAGVRYNLTFRRS